jgi:hypothetical protein
MVLLKPTRWGKKEYDELTQTFRWSVGDTNGRLVDLALPYDELAAPAIDALQHVQPRWHGIWGVIGQITFDRKGYHVRPLSLIGRPPLKGEQVCNVYFEQPAGRVGKFAAQVFGAKVANVMGSDIDQPELMISPWSPQIEREVAGLEGDLLHLAERGCAHPPVELAQRITSRGKWLSDQGFSLLAPANLAADSGFMPTPATSSGAAGRPGLAALRARFLCLLHRQLGMRAILESSGFG